MMRYFGLAQQNWRGDGHYSPREWVILSSGTVDRSEDGGDYDYCEPQTVTHVIQMTDEGWLSGISDSIAGPKRGLPALSIEAALIEHIRGLYTPSRCYCEHDCCGHRHGYAEVQHIGGAKFMIQVHTSRNY